jgi:hypothetical protein
MCWQDREGERPPGAGGCTGCYDPNLSDRLDVLWVRSPCIASFYEYDFTSADHPPIASLSTHYAHTHTPHSPDSLVVTEEQLATDPYPTPTLSDMEVLKLRILDEKYSPTSMDPSEPLTAASWVTDPEMAELLGEEAVGAVAAAREGGVDPEQVVDEVSGWTEVITEEGCRAKCGTGKGVCEECYGCLVERCSQVGAVAAAREGVLMQQLSPASLSPPLPPRNTHVNASRLGGAHAAALSCLPFSPPTPPKHTCQRITNTRSTTVNYGHS